MARVDITVTRPGVNLVLGGEIPDTIAAELTKQLTGLLHDKAAADPLITPTEPTAPVPAPVSDTAVGAG